MRVREQTATDASGNGYAGTYQNGPTLGAQGLLNGDNDTAVTFDGSNDHIDLPEGLLSSPSSGSSFSVEAWIKTTDTDGFIYAARSSASGNPAIQLYVAAGTLKGQVRPNSSSGTPYAVGGTQVVNDGAAHYVVLTQDGSGTMRLYLDGTQVNSASDNNAVVSGVDLQSIGADRSNGSTAASSLAGTIDEVAVYHTDLRPDQISNHFAAGTAGPDTSSEPVLTSTEADQATSVVQADPLASNILSGRAATLDQVASWTSDDGSQQYGAVLDYSWSTPATLTEDWPDIEFDASTSPPWQDIVDHYSASNVTGIHLLVDIACNRVVRLEPDAHASIDDSSISNVSGPSAPPSCDSGFGPRQLRLLSGSSDPCGVTGPWVHNVRLVSLGDNAFWNYDFSDNAPAGATACTPASDKYDWPITLIFWNSGIADHVEGDIYGGEQILSSDHDYVKTSGHPWAAINSSGEKSGAGLALCGTHTHYRIYQDPNHLSYTPYYGYLAAAEAHNDHNDNKGTVPFCRGSWSGQPEVAEKDVAFVARGIWGDTAVKYDHADLRNKETYHHEDNKYYGNDGRATFVEVCTDANGHDIDCP